MLASQLFIRSTLARAFPLRSQARILYCDRTLWCGYSSLFNLQLNTVDDYLFQLPAEQVYAVDEHQIRQRFTTLMS